MYGVIGLFTTMIVILLGIRYIVHKHYKFNATPNLKPYPIYHVVDGVQIGPNTYGDLNERLCVSVIDVSDGMVAFKYISPSHNGTICTVPVKSFLESFHKFPNGCNFL